MCLLFFFFSSSRTHPRQSWYPRGSRQRYQPHLHYFVNTSAASLCLLVPQWKCKSFHQTKLRSYLKLAQSICTHYSCFEIMGRFATLKKNRVQNMGCKKQGAKNRVIVIQKERRQPGLFSFWITMTLFFAPLRFATQTLKQYQVELIN